MSNEQQQEEEEETKKGEYTSIRIKRDTFQRFRLQGYLRGSADETLRAVLDKVETCRCRSGPRRLTI
jgi:hypothetical protein